MSRFRRRLADLACLTGAASAVVAVAAYALHYEAVAATCAVYTIACTALVIGINSSRGRL